MAKKYNLEETWRLCLLMWRWIIGQVKENPNFDIYALKKEWMQKEEYEILHDCFFCYYGVTHAKRVKNIGGGCSDCPGTFVDNQFYCDNKKYNWKNHPIAFYNKLVSLNRKRKKRSK